MRNRCSGQWKNCLGQELSGVTRSRRRFVDWSGHWPWLTCTTASRFWLKRKVCNKCKPWRKLRRKSGSRKRRGETDPFPAGSAFPRCRSRNRKEEKISNIGSFQQKHGKFIRLRLRLT